MVVLAFLAVRLGRVVEWLAVEYLPKKYVHPCEKRHVVHTCVLLPGLFVFVLPALASLVPLTRLVRAQLVVVLVRRVVRLCPLPVRKAAMARKAIESLAKTAVRKNAVRFVVCRPALLRRQPPSAAAPVVLFQLVRAPPSVWVVMFVELFARE